MRKACLSIYLPTSASRCLERRCVPTVSGRREKIVDMADEIDAKEHVFLQKYLAGMMESKRSLEGVAHARFVFKDKEVQTDSKMIGNYLDRKTCRTREIFGTRECSRYEFKKYVIRNNIFFSKRTWCNKWMPQIFPLTMCKPKKVDSSRNWALSKSNSMKIQWLSLSLSLSLSVDEANANTSE